MKVSWVFIGEISIIGQYYFYTCNISIFNSTRQICKKLHHCGFNDLYAHLQLFGAVTYAPKIKSFGCT